MRVASLIAGSSGMLVDVGASDDRLAVTDTVRIPRHELDVRFSASGGPGGQHANKTATRAELDVRRRVVLGIHAGAARATDLQARTGGSRRRRRRAFAASQPGARRGATGRAIAKCAARATQPTGDETDPRLATASRRREEATRRDQALPPAAHSGGVSLERDLTARGGRRRPRAAGRGDSSDPAAPRRSRTARRCRRSTPWGRTGWSGRIGSPRSPH